jgi:lysozyme family protein
VGGGAECPFLAALRHTTQSRRCCGHDDIRAASLDPFRPFGTLFGNGWFRCVAAIALAFVDTGVGLNRTPIRDTDIRNTQWPFRDDRPTLVLINDVRA